MCCQIPFYSDEYMPVDTNEQALEEKSNAVKLNSNKEIITWKNTFHPSKVNNQ